jgi:hypothetical protein
MSAFKPFDYNPSTNSPVLLNITKIKESLHVVLLKIITNYINVMDEQSALYI